MISFVNDYSVIASPEVMDLMVKYNGEMNSPYSSDYHSQRAKELVLKKIKKDDVFVQIFSGGTQTNLIAAAAFLRPHEAIIGVKTAHIMVHETGAIEATGHKCIEVEGKDGKIRPEDIDLICAPHNWDHAGILTVKPRMVFISQTTELGSVYSAKELRALRETCDKYNLLLYCDGARLASALDCSDVDLVLLADLCDAFYIGGAKNGAMFGEMMIVTNEKLIEDLRYIAKQRGGMLAKGFTLAIQFEALLTYDLYEKNGRHANRMADILREGLSKAGVEMTVYSPSNQIFASFPNHILDRLKSEFVWETISTPDEDNTEIRLVTSWYTKEEDCRYFVEKLLEYSSTKE